MFATLDLVRLGTGQTIIVTGETGRPLNRWRGVLQNGQGKEYIFGMKHRPVKVGVVQADHPALVAADVRKERKQAGMLPPELTAILTKLVETVDGGGLVNVAAFCDEVRPYIGVYERV